jgi:hypothetical protein
LRRSLNRNSTLLLVGIGLLHGLGFASVLSEIGLPQGDLILALLSFNIDIEIGQLVTLAAVVGVSMVVRRIAPVAILKPLPLVISFLTGSLAMFWTFKRIAGFYA